MADLFPKVKTLQATRANFEVLQETLRARRAAFEAEHQELIAAYTEARAAVEAAEEVVRTAALQTFQPGGDKTLPFGIVIRESVEVSGWDAEAALKFAKKTGIGLSADRKVLEDLAAKSPGSVPFLRAAPAFAATLPKQERLDRFVAEEVARRAERPAARARQRKAS